MKDYYKILGITQDAPQNDIRSAYRIRAKATHPDINHYAGASEAFVEVNEAYEILSDVRKRAAYDRQLAWSINYLKEQARAREQQQRQQAAGAQHSPSAQAKPRQQSAASSPPPKAAPEVDAWARAAQQRARTHAGMRYSEFEKTKFYRMERSVQNAMIWPMFALGGLLTLFILLLPFVLTFTVGWPAIFLGVAAFPVAFKSFSILQNTLREYRNTP